jgi:hypothetical protein
MALLNALDTHKQHCLAVHEPENFRMFLFYLLWIDGAQQGAAKQGGSWGVSAACCCPQQAQL